MEPDSIAGFPRKQAFGSLLIELMGLLPSGSRYLILAPAMPKLPGPLNLCIVTACLMLTTALYLGREVFPLLWTD